MKHILIVFFLVPKYGFSQFESKKNPVKFSAKLPAQTAQPQAEAPKFSFPKTPQYSNNFPDINKTSPKPNTGIVQNKFVNPHSDLVDRLNRKEGSEIDGSKSDRFLGDFRNSGKFVRIVCRDFGEVDGDRVRVYNNDKVVRVEIELTSNFQEVNVDLQPGFNKIDFQALNMGTSGPNTAEFRMYDDNGKLITSNMWNLTTGIKATLIVTKE
jgi:antitoxin component YwqK of YwqJK toxin-antitoxin module